MIEIDKIVVQCPSCGWKPKSPLFLVLPTSNFYCNEPDRHMLLKCYSEFCDKGNYLMDWLILSPHNKEKKR